VSPLMYPTGTPDKWREYLPRVLEFSFRDVAPITAREFSRLRGAEAWEARRISRRGIPKPCPVEYRHWPVIVPAFELQTPKEGEQ
jgi:hypothetical protein